jgi:4'-phosphopantetheinyl transferase
MSDAVTAGLEPAAWRPPPAGLALGDAEVHVWRVALAPAADEVAALARTLDDTERARAGRFHFERDRVAFTVVRGALRTLIGRYLGRPPASIAFGYAARGKPHLALDQPGRGLGFNVSHSGGWGLLAFARDRELGVDVERRRPIDELDSLARHSFSPHELAAWRALPAHDRADAFFRCWARKEAFIKATGEGIAQLAEFDVELRPGEPARLLRTPEPPGGSPRWSLCDLPELPDHAAALVVDGPASQLTCWAWPAAEPGG